MRKISNQKKALQNKHLALMLKSNPDQEVTFSNCDFTNTNLTSCDLEKFDFDENCNLTEAIVHPSFDLGYFERIKYFLTGMHEIGKHQILITPTNEEILEFTSQLNDANGIKKLNSFLGKARGIAQNKIVIADLSNLNFTGMDPIDMLGGMDFSETDKENQFDFSGADLSGTYLAGADFSHVTMKNVILTSANMKGTKFNDALMNSARIYESNCENAEFIRTDLEGAKIIASNLTSANFQSANLKNAHIEDNVLDLTWLFGAETENAKGSDISQIKEIQAEQSKPISSKFEELLAKFPKFDFSEYAESISKYGKKTALGALLGFIVGQALNSWWNPHFVTTIYQDLSMILAPICAMAAPFVGGYVNGLVTEQVDHGKSKIKNMFLFAMCGAMAACALLALAPSSFAVLAVPLSMIGAAAGVYIAMQKSDSKQEIQESSAKLGQRNSQEEEELTKQQSNFRERSQASSRSCNMR